MKVKDLKKLLEGVDDEMDVFIPMNPEFDGYFQHPCIAETGVTGLGVSETKEEPAFVIVPHGFFDVDHDAPDPALN